MNVQINLLTQFQQIPAQILKLSKILQKISIIIISVFMVITIIVFAIQFFLSNQVKKIEASIISSTGQIKDAQSTEALYLAYTQKVVGLDSLLKERYFPKDIIKEFRNAIGGNINIASFNLSKEGITFEADSDNVENIQTAINNLQTKLTIPISEIKMQSLEKTKTGRYKARLYVIFSLPKNQAKKT